MPRSRPEPSAEASETIKPPSNGELLAGMLGMTLLVLLLGVVADSVAWLVGFMVFLPAAAAALCTVRQTVFVCAWTATAATLISFVWGGNRGSLLDGVLMTLFTVCLGGASVYACRRRVQGEQDMLRLRSTAGAMQRQILRPLPLVTPDVLVHGLYEPLQEDRLVGGDIYDVIDSPWGTRVLVGDVQGKGLAALGAAFAVIGAFREAAHREPTLTALADVLDSSVVRHNSYADRAGDDERFVTALVVGIDAHDEVQAVNCGHVPPQLLHDGKVSTPDLDVGVPLGLAALAEQPVTVSWFPFPAGATLVLSTDGLTETRAADGTFYPLDERLAAHTDVAPTTLPRALYDDARAFARPGEPQDDFAVLAVRRSPRRVAH
ncbi:PP2C family protein-serine/threonine phosphatase [Streptomyces sp. NPDC058683]|uniref:PP2C family protein-serine/threonine phosphatase n=1 Tax=Streptomyces sp. NPDC058683 TaxID=3346597 RepID=UPI0036548499